MSTQSTPTDVTICYYGGSGGFFCLYLLLLSNQYKCFFEDGTHSAYETKSAHWDIKEVAQWKSGEIWPDNHQTARANFEVNKVFFLCNPLPITHVPGEQVNMVAKFAGKKILLYTDLATQWHLAKTKRAYWFQLGKQHNGKGTNWHTPEYQQEQIQIQYNNIKKPEWPTVTTLADFNALPQAIKDVCILEHSMWEVVDIGKFDEPGYFPPGVEYKGDLVYKKVVDVIPQMDIVIKLQDLIKTQGRILFDQLGISSNAETQKFLIYYLSLHNAEQLKFLLNKH